MGCMQSFCQFICGDDDYLVAEKGRELFAAASRDLEDDLAMEVIDGRAANVAEVERIVSQFSSAVMTRPLFGDRKVVWLKEINFLANNQTGNAQGTLDLLENLKALIESLDPEGIAIILTAYPVYKVRNFYKWAQKKTQFVNIAGGKDPTQACVKLIQVACQSAQVNITREAVQLLLGRVQANTRMAAEEIRKLIDYIGPSGESIQELMVSELVPNFGEADFFEATDTFYSLNLERTLRALDRHFFTNSEARPLLGSLQSRNRLLIQLRALIDSSQTRLKGARALSKNELLNAAGIFGEHYYGLDDKSNLNIFTQNSFYLSRLLGIAQKVPLKKLIDFQLAFSDAFEALFERPTEQAAICRELAIDCLS